VKENLQLDGRWSHRIQLALSVVMTLCAVLVAVRVFSPRTATAIRPAYAGAIDSVPNWELYGEAGHQIGTPGASVSIVVFLDYLCPACAQFDGTLDSLLAKRRGEVSVKVRHFPLDRLHPLAEQAAVAAECAASQGRFEEMHRLLLANQRQIGVASWWRLAEQAGVLDSAAFDSCIQERTALPRIAADREAAAELAARGTPTILVNDVRLFGSLPFEFLDSLVTAKRVENRRPRS
jgi:protein-disulfide isomerase